MACWARCAFVLTLHTQLQSHSTHTCVLLNTLHICTNFMHTIIVSQHIHVQPVEHAAHLSQFYTHNYSLTAYTMHMWPVKHIAHFCYFTHKITVSQHTHYSLVQVQSKQTFCMACWASCILSLTLHLQLQSHSVHKNILSQHAQKYTYSYHLTAYTLHIFTNFTHTMITLVRPVEHATHLH